MQKNEGSFKIIHSEDQFWQQNVYKMRTKFEHIVTFCM